MIFTQIEILRK